MTCSRVDDRSTIQRGWALPAVLSLLLIISLMVRLALVHAFHRIDVSRALDSRSVLENQFVEHLGEANWDGAHSECREFTEGSGMRLAVWNACGEQAIHMRAIPDTGTGTFLFNLQIFEKATDCKGTIAPINDTVLSGPVASDDCIITQDVKSSLVLKTNIRASTVQVSAPRRDRALLLATPGRGNFEHLIAGEGDLLVITGGDLDIRRIEGARRKRSKITLISLRGSITVGEVAGQISLLSLAPRDVSTPRTPFFPPYPLPPLRSPTVSAIGGPAA